MSRTTPPLPSQCVTSRRWLLYISSKPERPWLTVTLYRWVGWAEWDEDGIFWVLKDERGGDISHRTPLSCTEVCGLSFLAASFRTNTACSLKWAVHNHIWSSLAGCHGQDNCSPMHLLAKHPLHPLPLFPCHVFQTSAAPSTLLLPCVPKYFRRTPFTVSLSKFCYRGSDNAKIGISKQL